MLHKVDKLLKRLCEMVLAKTKPLFTESEIDEWLDNAFSDFQMEDINGK